MCFIVTLCSVCLIKKYESRNTAYFSVFQCSSGCRESMFIAWIPGEWDKWKCLRNWHRTDLYTKFGKRTQLEREMTEMPNQVLEGITNFLALSSKLTPWFCWQNIILSTCVRYFRLLGGKGDDRNAKERIIKFLGLSSKLTRCFCWQNIILSTCVRYFSL